MELIRYLKGGRGRAAGLARQIGVTPVTVHQWARRKKRVAAARCVAIEQATAGAVTRQDLRPEDWRRIWPELAAEEQSAA